MLHKDKLSKAISTLKSGINYTNHNSIVDTEEKFNKIIWVTGHEESSTPPSEITWTMVKDEMDRVQAEYDSLEYVRKRKSEYPSISDLVVALYDTEDKIAIDIKRTEIKLKYPKP